LKGSSMDSEWRTIQLFLDEDLSGVHEVRLKVTINSKKMSCSCQAYEANSRCKHIRYIKDAMNKNDGHYAIQIPYLAAEDDSVKAIKTADDWRRFVVKYAKIVVL
jgi:hypothetical protein